MHEEIGEPGRGRYSRVEGESDQGEVPCADDAMRPSIGCRPVDRGGDRMSRSKFCPDVTGSYPPISRKECPLYPRKRTSARPFDHPHRRQRRGTVESEPERAIVSLTGNAVLPELMRHHNPRLGRISRAQREISETIALGLAFHSPSYCRR